MLFRFLTLDTRGNYSEALTYYDKALKIEQNDSTAVCTKNNELVKLGQMEEAKKYEDRAKQLKANCNQTVVSFSKPDISTIFPPESII